MSELKELKGYKEAVEKLKTAGFPTFASIMLMKQENEKLKTDQKEILEDNDYWQEQFTEADKERVQLQKENEELKATISQMETVTEKNSEAEKWYVTYTSYDDKLSITEKGLAGDTKFTGTKEESEKFISEHSKPKYRPFKDCAELIETWCNLVQKKCDPYREENYSKNTLALPIIWVKNDDGHRFLISYFGKENVIADGNIDMDLLFEEYSFLDGSVCGVEE